MELVYNLKNPTKAVKKGLVEIVNLYHEEYYSIFVDGQLALECRKETDVLKRSFIKEAESLSGIDEENLTFVMINLNYFVNRNKYEDYDAGDYYKYSNLLKTINEIGIDKLENCDCCYIATGISQLEYKL